MQDINESIRRLKTLQRFGGESIPYLVFSDGAEYQRTLEDVVGHCFRLRDILEKGLKDHDIRGRSNPMELAIENSLLSPYGRFHA